MLHFSSLICLIGLIGVCAVADGLRFEDPYFGVLVPSERHQGFLTPEVEFRDQVLVYPTDEQKELMTEEREERVGGRWKRSDYNNFNLRKFIRDEFGDIIAAASSPPPNIRKVVLEQAKEDVYFKAFMVSKKNLKSYVENGLKNSLERVKHENKSWLPVEDMIDEIKDCEILERNIAGKDSFDYNQESGGTIGQYKFTCEQISPESDHTRIAMVYATFDGSFKIKGAITWEDKQEISEYVSHKFQIHIYNRYKSYFTDK